MAITRRIGAQRIRDRLLALIGGQTLVLLVDMTATTACDHACGDALARVYQRAMANGVGLRLIADVDTVLRMLAMSGLDRVVSVYRTLGAALSATELADTAELPGERRGTTMAPERSFPVGDVGVEMALLDVCAAAAGDLVTARVEGAVRRALTGDLPGSFTLEIPCRGRRRCWPPVNPAPESRDVASSAA